MSTRENIRLIARAPLDIENWISQKLLQLGASTWTADRG